VGSKGPVRHSFLGRRSAGLRVPGTTWPNRGGTFYGTGIGFAPFRGRLFFAKSWDLQCSQNGGKRSASSGRRGVFDEFLSDFR
jgi:hypothetical protein